ncbi:phosphotransferase family protein [Patulibacter minatonensis]|uniref:phosphotransferase family protein n=1 Tax=Patulibacter minatonensis TaxID=298163 RepID=UPI0004BB50CE|nr:phosphotransferase family protein [Patulibacter minatonensis]
MTELDPTQFHDRVSRSVAARFPGATVEALDRLHGGVSSLTFRAALAGAPDAHRRIVVKVAPPGLEPVRNRDVLRQARVLDALHPVSGVAAPEVLFTDDGAPPLFAMTYVDGQSYEPLTDVLDDPPEPEVVRERAEAAARMLARLQGVEPADVGLADEPVLSPAEELGRWRRLFETCPDDLRGDEDALHAELVRDVPESVEARILHGDYRLANMQFDGARLAALIDWEIWSVGDPRSDLAWLLMHTDPRHRFAGPPDDANRRAGEGMPTREELLATYRREREIDTAELPWFLGCCHYKTASTIAVLAKQNRRREQPDAAMVRAEESLPAVIGRGLELVRAADRAG